MYLIFAIFFQFDQSELAIDGKQMQLKSDESFLYWTPAPPKYDVAPNDVKQQLFPMYGGAALAGDTDAHSVVTEESEIEETVSDETDPEDRMAKDRYTCVYSKTQLSTTYTSSKTSVSFHTTVIPLVMILR